MFNLLRTIGLAVIAWLIPSVDSDAWADPDDNFMAQAVKLVQPKMVKVYGASAGRIEGYATGIAVSDSGRILTTQGVFLDGSQIRVVTFDGVSHIASIVKRDREHQLALLQIATETPEYFVITEQESVQKGDWVIAISNAFKVADKQEPLSATLGVISLRTSIEARLNKRDVAYRGDLILIDQITSNPGAAGGAVVTTDGELVGVIGKIIDSSETNTRLNYAVPNSVLTRFLADDTEQIVRSATVERQSVELGIRIFSHGGRNSPAYIDRIARGSPAAKARMKPDDLLISIAGEKIGNVKDYEAVLINLRPDEEAIVVVKRGAELLRLTIIPVAKE